MALNAKRLIKEFINEKSELTALAYRSDLEDFRIFMKAASPESAVARMFGGDHLSGQQLLAGYRRDMKVRRDLGPATINRRLSMLRSLGKEARILGMVPWVLTAKNEKEEFVRETRGPGEDASARFFSFMQTLEATAPVLRDLAMFRLMSEVGLRRGAICRVDIRDFNPETLELRVREKGKKLKAPAKLPASTANAISRWLSVHPKSAGAMFVNFDTIHKTKTGKRITGSAIYAALKKRWTDARLPGPIRPHGLRHTAITMAGEVGGEKGYGLDKIKAFSGHKHVRTLERYLDEERTVQGELGEGVSERLNRVPPVNNRLVLK